MNVIQCVDGVAKYELNGDEIVFPLAFDQGGVDVVAYFHADAQILPHEYKNVLDSLMGRYRTNDVTGERELEAGDDSICRAFIDKHFRMKISGVEGDPTPDVIKVFLEANPNIKTRLFSEGYDRVLVDVDDQPKLTLSLGAGPSAIRTKRIVYSPLTERVETVHFKHVHRRETEEDRIRYRRAGKQIERGRFVMFRLNWDTIEQMYDGMIEKVEGYTIDGAPCDESNSGLWVKKIPFVDKAFVVMRIFARNALKNA